MTYVPDYVILPAQKIPLYCENYDGGEIKVKQAVKEAFNGKQIIWTNQTFVDIWDCKAKFQVLKGGSGSGKSRFVVNKLLTKCISEPYFRCLYIRKSFADIKKSCFQLLKDVINENGWEKIFTVKESDFEIICNLNGNKFVPAGLDDVEKLKSIEGITDVWLEEAITAEKKVTDKEFRELVRRVRTNKASLHFYITFNPVDKDNFIYRIFVEGKKYPKYDKANFKKNSFIIHNSTYQDNFFLTDEYREEYELLKGEDYQEWLIYACGEWGNPRTGNEYLYKFKKDVHIVSGLEYSPKKKTILVVDFNVNPFITGLVYNYYFTDGKRYMDLVDEICLSHPENDIEYLVYEFKKRGYLGFNKIISWLCDATGKNKIPGFGDKKEVIPYQYLKKLMNKFCSSKSDRTVTMKKNPSKLVAKTALNKIFANVSHNDKIKKSNIVMRVSDKCLKSIDEYSYLQNDNDGFDNERTTIDGKTAEKRGHIMSCTIYAAHYAFREYFPKKKKLY